MMTRNRAVPTASIIPPDMAQFVADKAQGRLAQGVRFGFASAGIVLICLSMQADSSEPYCSDNLLQNWRIPETSLSNEDRLYFASRSWSTEPGIVMVNAGLKPTD
jgi:hypothetical protein